VAAGRYRTVEGIAELVGDDPLAGYLIVGSMKAYASAT
jgi:hypothetical protein